MGKAKSKWLHFPQNPLRSCFQLSTAEADFHDERGLRGLPSAIYPHWEHTGLNVDGCTTVPSLYKSHTGKAKLKTTRSYCSSPLIPLHQVPSIQGRCLGEKFLTYTSVFWDLPERYHQWGEGALRQTQPPSCRNADSCLREYGNSSEKQLRSRSKAIRREAHLFEETGPVNGSVTNND